MNTISFAAFRGSRGVALVELDGRRVGSVRKFGSRWYGKLDSEELYPTEGVGYRTRQLAAADVAARECYRRSGIAHLDGRYTEAELFEADARMILEDAGLE